MASFTELDVWKKARSIRIQIKELTASFPVDEKFRLTDQIIRSSRSIGDNIAEGHGRFHYQDNIRFCVIARGSLTETLDHLIVGFDDGLVSKEQFTILKDEIDLCMAKLNGYILFIKTKRDAIGVVSKTN